MELDFRGLRLTVPEGVYMPAEDSFMLASAASGLRGGILEIGCGSGIASLSAARADPANEVLGVDINPEAVACATRNAEANAIRNARFIVSDLFSEVPRDQYDAIMFNPPYLPTAASERLKGPINHAFDGGPDGRKVLDRFLGELGGRLRPGGIILLVQSSLNGMEATEDALRGMGCHAESLSEERFFFERLSLLRAVKP
jgi:release factor glutamine methyltransferase